MNKRSQKKSASATGKRDVKYWSSLDELQGVPGNPEEDLEKKDKAEVLNLLENNMNGAGATRRDFLKLFGFSVTTAALAASCERPVHKAIPYVVQPEEIIPGKSLHYASTFFDGKDFCNILVKTREGRPIKIEGNTLSPFNGAGTTARVQASVLSLYDDARYKQASKNSQEAKTSEVTGEIVSKLNRFQQEGKEVVLFTSTVNSPSTLRIIEELKQEYPGISWVEYDAVSSSAIRKAYGKAYNSELIPDFRFDNADVVVSFGADFLGSWLAPGHFIPGYARRRRLSKEKPDMLRHYQFESALSLTGSNADHRFPVKPEDEKTILLCLYNELAKRKGRTGAGNASCDIDVSALVDDMEKAGPKSLVVSSSNDIENQMLVIAINEIQGAIGTTVDLNNALSLSRGDDLKTSGALKKILDGNVAGAIFCDVNPVYDYPAGKELQQKISSLEMAVSLSWTKNETAEACNYILPTHHYLESWGDYQVSQGQLSLAQPVIQPLFETSPVQDYLLVLAGSQTSYHQYLMDFWKEQYWNGSGKFKDFWNRCLRDGIYKENISGEWKPEMDPSVIRGIKPEEKQAGFTLTLAESVQMGDGKHANNPWLQELPDPIAKICWDNFVSFSPADAREMGIENGDVVSLNAKLEAPALIQPGQARSTLTISLGYGRESAGKVGEGIGANAFRMVEIKDGLRQYHVSGVKVEKTGENIILAFTQTHNSMEGRPIVRESNLDEYKESPDAGNEFHAEAESHHKTLYPEVDFDGFHWGLAVDLNACVGCNNCVISCQAENNIPVVGKDEVYRRRIMHWIKIDRYYSDDPKNPKVSYQPNMCQHCDNAPCENVCPVSATNHSSEGINQMSYNRCIGTKYCINNCPYRARRFNWYQYVNNEEFDFNTHSDLGKMVLNPDVTVRSRGVVEKCSFCVQRIQEKKLEAKLENRTPEDGEIQPACVQSCPAGALVFGNLKDKDSEVSRLFANERNYHLLEQLHTLPSVGYLTKIRNEKKS